MLRNYFTTAVRNLAKNRFFTVLNIFCLALGMSISLLFVAEVSFVYRYDNFHANGDRIYRVTTQVKDNDQNPEYASAPLPLVHNLREDFTGIETVVPIQRAHYEEASYADKPVQLYGLFAGPEFLQVFNFPLIKGSATNALTSLNSIVITEEEAFRIFGDKEPIGERITMKPYGDLVVTGILKEMPKNSHIMFDALISYSTFEAHAHNESVPAEEAWKKFPHSYVYLLLSEGIDPADIENHLNTIGTEKYKTPNTFAATFELQSLADIVPGPRMTNPIGMTWDFLSFLLMGITTSIILIPACANYVSLAISQSLKRMKEVGVRKVMGGQRKQIFSQFVMETVVTMFLALGLSGILFQILSSEFLAITGYEDLVDLSPTFSTLIFFVAFALIVGLIAGVTPALYFSKISPLKALKGKPEKTTGGFQFPIRKVIITAQFMLSLGFITAVVILTQQYRYSITYDLGYQQENIMNVELRKVDPTVFKNEFGKISSVERISMSSHRLGLEFESSNYITELNRQDSIESNAISIDENFISNLELELLAGKDFNENLKENAQFIIVNENFVRKLEIEDLHSAIGKFIQLPGGRSVRIGGVVKNFHYAGLTEQIKPLYLEYDPSQFKYANMKVTFKNNAEQMATMDALWKKIGGDDKLTAKYFKEEIEEAYSFYFEMLKLWGFLGLLAITVACLGLLGTVVFTLRNRIKEVTIRKIVGASTENLVLMLSKEFILLLVVASVITLPTVYYVFVNVLFPSVQYYSVSVGFLELAISVVITLGLGLVTILSQTITAANTNPVENLRVE